MSEDGFAEEGGEPTNTPESFEKQQETIAALREQLAQANERDRENRRIIAALTSRIPAIEAPQEPRESSETGAEKPETAQPRSDALAPERPVEGRPWWRRVFGGGPG